MEIARRGNQDGKLAEDPRKDRFPFTSIVVAKVIDAWRRNLPRRSKDIPVRWLSSILTEEKSAAAWLCRRRCAPVHHVPAKTVIVHARLSVRESLRERDWVLLREMMQRYGFPPPRDRVLLKANDAIRVLSSGFRVPAPARPSTNRHSDSQENVKKRGTLLGQISTFTLYWSDDKFEESTIESWQRRSITCLELGQRHVEREREILCNAIIAPGLPVLITGRKHAAPVGARTASSKAMDQGNRPGRGQLSREMFDLIYGVT